MEAVRTVYRQLPDVLKMPKKLQHRCVEVILLPLDAGENTYSFPELATTPLASFAGAWVGEPIAREDQGNYEVREEFK